MLLKDCDLIINLDKTDYEEHKVLLLRAGLNPDSFDHRREICVAHRDILGRSFNGYLNSQYCCHTGHFDKTTTKLDYRGRQITYDEALAALQCQDLKLPLNMPICKLCYDSVSMKIGTLPMETETEQNVVSPESSESLVDPLSLESLSEEIGFIPTTRPVTRANTPTNTQANKQTSKQTHKQTNKQTDKETCKQTNQNKTNKTTTTTNKSDCAAECAERLNDMLTGGIEPTTFRSSV